jgi:zinc D-Ala-D-Ala carboxypeptidase
MTWKNFDYSDFACKGSGENEMRSEFIDKLQRLRDTLGFPLIVSSGYRSPEHNAKVSKTGRTGPHTTGRAVDLAVGRGRAYLVLKAAFASGEFTGIGVHQRGEGRFIHLDDIQRDEPTVWSY